MNNGIKHIPEPKDTTKDELLNAIDSYINKIGWKNKFQYDECDNYFTYDPTFKIPLQPFPNKDKNNNLKVLHDSLKRTVNYYDLKNPIQQKFDPTRTLQKYLLNHPEIKLVLSDKNLGLIAMNTTIYHSLVLSHLTKQEYSWICKNDRPLFFLKFHSTLKQKFDSLLQYLQRITDNPHIKRYLEYHQTKTKWTIPQFHNLIKLHKGTIELQSRPIVGAVDWFTTPISKLLSKMLRAYLTTQETRHIASNTIDVVMDMNNWNFRFFKHGKRHQNYHLISLDIVNLYGNIKLNTLYELLRKHTNDDFVKLAKFVCDNNYFGYLSDIYKQDDGIAMGTNAAPELANFYLLHSIDSILINLWNPNITFTKRFLDDIFIIYEGTKEECLYFISCLNTLKKDCNMEFTSKVGKQIEFLDLNIILTPEGLEYYTHQKKLNKYGYITPSSCHPHHTLSGFIKGELTRYSINSSKSYYYKITKNLFYQRLLARGYKRTYLNSIFQSHIYSNRFNRKPDDKTEYTNLSIRFSRRQNLSRLKQSITLVSERICKRFLSKPKIRITWLKSRNLYEILCRSSLSTKQQAYILSNSNEITPH